MCVGVFLAGNIMTFILLSLEIKKKYSNSITAHSTFTCFWNMYNIQCPVSNNGFGSFWFGMVPIGHGSINCLALGSFVVSFS